MNWMCLRTPIKKKVFPAVFPHGALITDPVMPLLKCLILLNPNVASLQTTRPTPDPSAVSYEFQGRNIEASVHLEILVCKKHNSKTTLEHDKQMMCISVSNLIINQYM